MPIDEREPLLNALFRVEIEGLQETGAVEVVFPEGRIVGSRERRAVQYGPLTLRRGMTSSNEWYQWWDRARGTMRAPARSVVVVVMNRARGDVRRWVFSGAVPSAYAVSPLNALGHEALMETLELAVTGFSMTTAGASDVRAAAPSPARRSGPRPVRPGRRARVS